MTTIEMTEAYEVGQAMVAWGEAMQQAIRALDTSVLDKLCNGHTVSDQRRESLAIALGLGADDATLARLRDATRLARRPTIILPPGRYEHCSRGRGWARMGRGSDVTWGERVDTGYQVGPGRWTVGSTDGFSRKKDVVWDVEHIAVGDQTWTVAS